MLLITCTLHICWAEIKEYCIVLYCSERRKESGVNDLQKCHNSNSGIFETERFLSIMNIPILYEQS